jgi:hypothetical protein
MTRKRGQLHERGFAFLLLVKLSFEGSRVERRPLAIHIIFIIDIHGKIVRTAGTFDFCRKILKKSSQVITAVRIVKAGGGTGFKGLS